MPYRRGPHRPPVHVNGDRRQAVHAGAVFLVSTLAGTPLLRGLPLGPALIVTGPLQAAAYALPAIAPIELIPAVALHVFGYGLIGVRGIATSTLLLGSSRTGRATTMTINNTAFSVGTAVGSSLGGLALALGGYIVLGWTLLPFGLAATVLAALSRPGPFGRAFPLSMDDPGRARAPALTREVRGRAASLAPARARGMARAAADHTAGVVECAPGGEAVREVTPERGAGRRTVVAAALPVLLVYVVGWTGFLTAGEIGIRGGGPSSDARGRIVTGVAPGSAADRAGLRPGDEVVAFGGVDAAEAGYDRATVATRAGQAVTLRVRPVTPEGGYGPEKEVALTADPVLSAADKRGAAARDAGVGVVLLLLPAAVLLRWPTPGMRLVLLGAAAVAAAFGLRAWDVAFPDGVAAWRALRSALPVVGVGAALVGAAHAALGRRGRRGQGQTVAA